MMKPADLPDVIPIFPLAGALLLPRARLPLHIFEARYLAMLDDCLKTSQRLIGMVQPRDMPRDVPREVQRDTSGASERRLQSIGCAGRLTGFSETEDGRYMITLSGVSRFKLREEVDGFAPYRRAAVDWAPFAQDLRGTEADPAFRRPEFLDLLRRYFEQQNLSTDWEGLTEAEPELLINSLSMLCPFEPNDKQALLEAPSLSTRRETLVTLMEFSLHGGEGQETPQ